MRKPGPLETGRWHWTAVRRGSDFECTEGAKLGCRGVSSDAHDRSGLDRREGRRC